jgi:hypothetical protein
MLNKNVAALQDRGHVLMFQPGAAEVHRRAGTWFDDPEIYEWFAKNLHRVREPSMRHYVRARELKAAGMDWTDVLVVEAENKRSRLAAELLASDAYGSTAERVKAFVDRGGGSRASFSVIMRTGSRRGRTSSTPSSSATATATGCISPPSRLPRKGATVPTPVFRWPSSVPGSG